MIIEKKIDKYIDNIETINELIDIGDLNQASLKTLRTLDADMKKIFDSIKKFSKKIEGKKLKKLKLTYKKHSADIYEVIRWINQEEDSIIGV